MLKKQVIKEFDHMFGNITRYLAVSWKMPRAERIDMTAKALNKVATPILDGVDLGYSNIKEVEKAAKMEVAKLAKEWFNNSLSEEMVAL